MSTITGERAPNVHTKLLFEVGKRTFDIVAGLILLILFSPILAIIAVCIKRGSRGPVFFRQIRAGRGNKPFMIYKFRTMYVDADQRGPQITSDDDDRVTPLGKKLRNKKLDEIPQLINVLLGEMSLVGPRPQVLRFVDQFKPEHRDIVLSVRPGVTGPTQLKFRNEETMLRGQPDREKFYIEQLMPIKCELDMEYVRNRSMSYDVHVLTETFMLLLRGSLVKILGRGAEPAPNLVVVESLRERGANADVVLRS